jgi:hypothetical protein
MRNGLRKYMQNGKINAKLKKDLPGFSTAFGENDGKIFRREISVLFMEVSHGKGFEDRDDSLWGNRHFFRFGIGLFSRETTFRVWFGECAWLRALV